MAIKASNQITISDLTDAYSVFMDNDNYTFMADKDGYFSGSFIANIKAYYGTDVVEVNLKSSPGITFWQGNTQITGDNLKFKADFGGTSTARTVTVGLKTGITSASLTEPMEIRIPLQIDNNAIEMQKIITISSAKTGANGTPGAAGKGISSVTTYFQTNNNPTAPTPGTSSPWSTNPTAPDATYHYMWAFDRYTYTIGDPTNSAVRLAAEYTDANKWFQGNGVPSASTVQTAAHVGDQYLNTNTSSGTGDVYTCTAAGTPGTWSKTGNIKGANGSPGADGADGADAIQLEISANGPVVFRKNTDNVKISPVVRVAGETLTINTGIDSNPATVTIKGVTHYVRWYNGSTEITKANTANQVVAEKSNSQYTGSITVYGAYIQNAALIECRLDTSTS